jgi:hypothetical protein
MDRTRTAKFYTLEFRYAKKKIPASIRIFIFWCQSHRNYVFINLYYIYRINLHIIANLNAIKLIVEPAFNIANKRKQYKENKDVA